MLHLMDFTTDLVGAMPFGLNKKGVKTWEKMLQRH